MVKYMVTSLQNLTKAEIQKPKPASALQSTPSRIASIDILRAITMLLMIFVNDLWSLRNIPVWLEHVSRDTDGMGLADTIFPAFLFIVGMSIPFAVSSRRKKGDNNYALFLHIFKRTLALLVMGVFLVNGENINPEATGIPRAAWYTLSCISFILIWNTYSRNLNPVIRRILQGVGISILLFLAFIYRGGEAESLSRFSTYWWGILGIIGWSYFVSSLITAYSCRKYYFILAAWILFCGLSMMSSSDLISRDGMLQFIPGPIIGGTSIAFTLGGVLTTLVYQYFIHKNEKKKMMLAMLVIAIGLILLAAYTHNFWDISKLRSTPPWLFYCSSFTILMFMLIYWIADVKGKANWFDIIKPGGTDTLLCYLIPYFAYAIVSFSGISLPEFMLTGTVGLVKSLVFAFLCLWTAGFLSKKGIRLKL